MRLVYIVNGKPKGHVKNLSGLTVHFERGAIRTQAVLLLNLYPSSLLSGNEEKQEGGSVPGVSLWICKYLFTIVSHIYHLIIPTGLYKINFSPILYQQNMASEAHELPQ